MRGVLVAIYLFAASLLGQALGPWLVGLSTDRLFGAPERVRDSLVLVTSALLLAAAAFIWSGLRSGGRARPRVTA